ncbi:MAG: tetratricopeptide repeat protein [Alcanivoracaceae bacterium]|nr:tetratricopeptide repeat protein [Alcanivoracaceae bacterium]
MAMSEEEQIERLQSWWRENGTSLVAAIVVAVAAVVGWRHYQELERTEAAAASSVYENMTNAIQQAQQAPENQSLVTQAQASANTLVEEHANSAYADFARLFLARLAVEKDDLDEARTLLDEVAKGASDPAVAWTARLRLARVELQADDADAALAVLSQTYPDAFMGQALELKGDALRAKGDVAGARDAYSAALDAMSVEENRRLVQMKLDDLVPAS